MYEVNKLVETRGICKFCGKPTTLLCDMPKKVIAILEVNVDQMNEQGFEFETEMAWIQQSGITMTDYRTLNSCTEIEYAAFVWSKKTETYQIYGRPMASEILCKKRFQEAVKKNWIPKHLDSKDVIFKKRSVSVITGNWENT